MITFEWDWLWYGYGIDFSVGMISLLYYSCIYIVVGLDGWMEYLL